MDKMKMKKMLANGYERVAYTNNYILGFEYKGAIYAIECDRMVVSYLTLDKASRGAGYSLRFKPTIAQKKAMLADGAYMVCSSEYFGGLITETKYNRGEIFEKIITERNGQEWMKDNVPFTKAGDLIVDEISYQIKFEKATYCNEKSLANLGK